MALHRAKFQVEFIELAIPSTGQKLGLLGVDGGGKVYLPATLHPSAFTPKPNKDSGLGCDLGLEAYHRCIKAGSAAACFNGFYVEADWLRSELKEPFSRTENGRTLTNVMLGAAVGSMLQAAQMWISKKKGIAGTKMGVVDTTDPILLVEVGDTAASAAPAAAAAGAGAPLPMKEVAANEPIHG